MKGTTRHEMQGIPFRLATMEVGETRRRRKETVKKDVTPSPSISVPRHARPLRRVQPPRQRSSKRLAVATAAAMRDEEQQLIDIEDLFMSKDEANSIRQSLLDWYDLNYRELPWRRIDKQVKQEEEEEGEKGEREGEVEGEIRAYAVWVSEVMLQQTRVQTVTSYYNRWMQRWPTLHHLSRASLEDVNEMWAGLGYYRRARFLLEGAKKIANEGGGFPKTVSNLLKVPGIGDYTAGAIASIAFRQVVPVVDGNVIRVIARLKAISANPKDSKTIKRFWKVAALLVDPSRPGDFNQALMELGATVCKPLSPSCSSCPISNHCQALSMSRHDSSVLVTDYPSKSIKTKQRHDFSAVCVVEILGEKETSQGNQVDSGFLLIKRPNEGLLAGQWEFPSVLLRGESNLVSRRKAIDDLMKKYFNLELKKSCDVIIREHIGEFVHIFSHIRLKISVELLVIRLKGGIGELFGQQEKEPVFWKYVDRKAISTMGLTSSVKKVYNMIQKFTQNKVLPSPVPAQKRRKRI